MATQYSGFDLSALPKRRTSRTDLDAARALLATIEANGAASDMARYDAASKARNAGLRAARLVEHVAPNGKVPSIRTFGLDKKGQPTNDDPASFGWALTLRDEGDEETPAESE